MRIEGKSVHLARVLVQTGNLEARTAKVIGNNATASGSSSGDGGVEAAGGPAHVYGGQLIPESVRSPRSRGPATDRSGMVENVGA